MLSGREPTRSPPRSVSKALVIDGFTDPMAVSSSRSPSSKRMTIAPPGKSLSICFISSFIPLSSGLPSYDGSSSCVGISSGSEGRSLGRSEGKSEGSSVPNSLGRSEGCSVGTLDGFGEAPLLDWVPGTWFGSSDGCGDSVSLVARGGT